MGNPITSKDPFFSVRPGRTTGPRPNGIKAPDTHPAKVDAERHPATARYAKASGRLASPRLPEHWQLGYDRFGDEFEPLLAAITSQKPTEYAKALLAIDDKWKIVGKTAAELRPEEAYAWSKVEYETRGRALELILNGETHPRHQEILEWTGIRRVAVVHRRGWAEGFLQSAMRRLGDKERYPSHAPMYRRNMPEASFDDLIAIMDAGVEIEAVYAAWKSYDLTPHQLALHLADGIPADYANVL